MGTALRYEKRKAAPKPKWQMPRIGMAVAVLALIAGVSLSASIGSSAGISVTDGDTIRVAGHPVRLVGFNTPETFSPACAREQELGDRATRRLEELVAAAR